MVAPLPSFQVVDVSAPNADGSFFVYLVNIWSAVTATKTTSILPTAYIRRSTDDWTAFILAERTATAILAFSIFHRVRSRCGTNECWCVNGYERFWYELYMVRKC